MMPNPRRPVGGFLAPRGGVHGFHATRAPSRQHRCSGQRRIRLAWRVPVRCRGAPCSHRRGAHRLPRHALVPRFPSTVFRYTPAALYGPPVDPPAPVVTVSPVIYASPIVHVSPTVIVREATPAAATPPAEPAPPVPPMPNVVEYPTGRYELRGDGVTTPHVWARIPTRLPVRPPRRFHRPARPRLDRAPRRAEAAPIGGPTTRGRPTGRTGSRASRSTLRARGSRDRPAVATPRAVKSPGGRRGGSTDGLRRWRCRRRSPARLVVDRRRVCQESEGRGRTRAA